MAAIDRSRFAPGLLLRETQTLVREMPVRPPSSRVMAMNAAIKAMKSGGWWQRFDGLWVLGASAQPNAPLCWTSPGVLTLVENNSPTFTANRGYTGDGVSMSLSVPYTPSKWTQDNGSAGAIGLSNGSAASSVAVVNSAAAGRLNIRARNVTAASASISTNTHTNAATGAATPNMVAGERTDSANQMVYVNGSLDATGAQASVAFGGTPGTIWILGNGTTFSTQGLALVWIGAALGAVGQAAMTFIFRKFFAPVGLVF